MNKLFYRLTFRAAQNQQKVRQLSRPRSQRGIMSTISASGCSSLCVCVVYVCVIPKIQKCEEACGDFSGISIQNGCVAVYCRSKTAFKGRKLPMLHSTVLLLPIRVIITSVLHYLDELVKHFVPFTLDTSFIFDICA